MRVRFTQEARDDIASIHAYIAQHDASAAGRVVAAIEYSTKRLPIFRSPGGPAQLRRPGNW